MNSSRRAYYVSAWMTFLITALSLNPLFGQTPAFTYQGKLVDNGSLANGTYDLAFTLFNAVTNGAQQGNAQTNSATAVSSGLFTVTLDFGGGVFPGEDRWLEIRVRTNGAGAFTILTPRQKLNPTPYAITASSVATNGLPAGTYANAVSFTNNGNVFVGTGSGLNNLDAGKITIGTLGDSRLSTNVALLNRSPQTFTGTNVFNNRIGINTAAPVVPLHVAGGSDAHLGSGGFLVTGPTNGANVVIDDNEIMARNNGVAGILNLNNDGGTVAIGTSMSIRGLITPPATSATNLLSLGSGNTADGFRNGISFYESAGVPAMMIGYDGTVPGTANNAIRIYDNSGNAIFSFLHGGNIGIGTNAPAAKLHVNGTVQAEGTIKANGGLIIENRTSDPPSPATGQIWLRTDL